MMVWVLAPVLVFFLIFAVLCIVRALTNNSVDNRNRFITKELQDINMRYLKGTGVAIYCGLKAAWLEVEMDPMRTEITGSIVPDRRIYNGQEETIQVLKEETGKMEYASERAASLDIDRRPKNDIVYEDGFVYEDEDQLEEEIMGDENRNKNFGNMTSSNIINSTMNKGNDGSTGFVEMEYTSNASPHGKTNLLGESGRINVGRSASGKKLSGKKMAFLENLQK